MPRNLIAASLACLALVAVAGCDKVDRINTPSNGAGAVPVQDGVDPCATPRPNSAGNSGLPNSKPCP